jgi:hypothetical protein
MWALEYMPMYGPESVESTAVHRVSTQRWPPFLVKLRFRHSLPSSRSLPLSRQEMKSSTFICLAVAGSAHAFPNIVHHLAQRDSKAAGDSWGGLLPLTTPEFAAAAQYVDTTGEHAGKAPGEDDQRGPCPGLNALANHGYLPHNGIGTLDQFIDAVMKGV